MYDDLPVASFAFSYNNGSGFYKDSRYKLYQEITAFDGSKNPLTVITNLTTESYIWDGQHELPLAVISNASYQDIAYTSFDTWGNGNWTVSSPNRDLTKALTGKKSYLLSSGNVSKSGLTSSKKYTVSYWSSGGQLSITGTTSSKQGHSFNNWTYYEHVITGVTSVTLSGSVSIDELRLYPESSLMTTNVYEPLVGPVTMCDAKNAILSYEYQGMNKLAVVRDQNLNILKKICYNYAGQQEVSSQTYKNIVFSKKF